jgi:hypothetical protein
MGVVLDGVLKHTRTGQGHADFRGAEMNFSGNIDPYSKLYAIVNAKATEVEVEEAAFQTTRLPGNLTLRGGRYFANFGRLPKFHDHELPFVERTESLDRFMNGEAKTDGAELSHLFRTPFFLQGTVGLGNKLGAENARLNETTPASQDGHKNGRPLQAFTYNGRLFTYAWVFTGGLVATVRQPIDGYRTITRVHCIANPRTGPCLLQALRAAGSSPAVAGHSAEVSS